MACPDGVQIKACFATLCNDASVTAGYALVKLMTPSDYEGLIFDSAGNAYPCNQTWKFDIDGLGCVTTCPLPANTALSLVNTDGSPLTWYEMALFVEDVVGGETVINCCGAERFIIDCVNNVYPVPPDTVDLADVTIDSLPTSTTSYQCMIVKTCETPWTGDGGQGITVTAGDNAEGYAANGHEPVISLTLSSDADNVAVFGGDDGLFVPQTQVTVSDTSSIDMTISGDGAVGTPYIVSGAAKISGDVDNVITVEADGLKVASANNFVISDTSTINLTLTGDGSVGDPYTLSAAVKISADAGNGVSIVGDGIYVSRVTSFDLGQETDLGVTPSAPYIWRAPRDGTVTFDIAYVPYNGASPDGVTHFEIINELGAVVATHSLPIGATHIYLADGPWAVSQGEGYAVRVIAPFATTPANALTVHGEFVG